MANVIKLPRLPRWLIVLAALVAAPAAQPYMVPLFR